MQECLPLWRAIENLVLDLMMKNLIVQDICLDVIASNRWARSNVEDGSGKDVGDTQVYR